MHKLPFSLFFLTSALLLCVVGCSGGFCAEVTRPAPPPGCDCDDAGPTSRRGCSISRCHDDDDDDDDDE
jgi:hypothetical protein